MLVHLGLFLLLWLVIGFIAGLKAIYIDKRLSPEKLEKFRKEEGLEEDDGDFYLLFKSKATFLSICTLMGLFTMSADMVGAFKRKEH